MSYELIIKELSRIADALERLAPPLPPAPQLPANEQIKPVENKLRRNYIGKPPLTTDG